MQSCDVTATFCATLIDEFVALGVSSAVVAPGSRSTPMALAIGERPDIRLEVFHDERSAGFAALGIAKASGRPCLLLCTSGTAAANFYPAVIEASYAEIPLIVMTADRPPELQGLGAPQTIEQRNLYGVSTRLFVDSGVADDERADEWRRIAQRLFRAASDERPGPVQLNLPFREPLLGVAGAIPARSAPSPRRAHKPVGTEVLSRLSSRLGGRRGVIVGGAGGPRADQLIALAQHLGWPLLADPLGGGRAESPLAIRHADAWLRDGVIAQRFRPETILRFGSLPASKVVNTWMRECGAETTVITRSPFLVDPDRRASLHVVADPDDLCADLRAVVEASDDAWTTVWTTAEDTARLTIAAMLDDESRLSEPGAARTTVASLPTGSSLVVSSSMPIRDVEWYAGSCAHLRVFANRGVNGIDGVVSTAVGVALAMQYPTALLIGDVAFLHDSNGLIGLLHRDVDLRIVVIDNRGGGIFSFLPQRSAISSERFEQLFGTPHNSDIEAIAAAHGVAVASVSSSRDLRTVLSEKGPRVIVVSTNREDNVSLHDRLHAEVQRAVR